jgi:DNA-binding transcriptional LysR family regulator
MYKLNFNHLHYFLTISEEGSIVKAAKKLNMTQPSLSHQLKIVGTRPRKKAF